MRKKIGVLVPFLLLSLLLPAAAFATDAAKGKAALSVGDCAKCHERQPAEIATNGAKHNTEINCQDCHTGHRPAVAKNIPQCSMCHSGQKHFELEGCIGCHNPHQPLDITLKGQMTAPCLTCHAGIGEELVSHPSKHTKLACNACHADKHGNIPECGVCHKPHSAEMTQNDCKLCHQPHQPKTLQYGAQTASVLCASCHKQAFNLLAASSTKHRDVSCVTCHQNKHKNVPQCNDCHGQPHPEAMHQMFPKCSTCHNVAHNLNNWPAQDKNKPAPTEKAAQKEPVKKDTKKR